MAQYNPTRIRRIGTGNTGRVRSLVPGTDTINPAVLDPGIRNDILLINGFLLPRDSSMDMGSRRAYTGSLTGLPSATYWYDSSDRSWYDAATAGNRLAGFGGTT